jgi:hypothetical protein
MSTVDSSQGFEINKKLSFILLLNLSTSYQNQSQNNTVCPEQEEMDRVGGFEPTTSAYQSELYLFESLHEAQW